MTGTLDTARVSHGSAHLATACPRPRRAPRPRALDRRHHRARGGPSSELAVHVRPGRSALRTAGRLSAPAAALGGSGTLSDREREIIATVVSVDNGCAYCHTHHVHTLGEVLGDHWLAAHVGFDHRAVAELSEREHALASLAETPPASGGIP